MNSFSEIWSNPKERLDFIIAIVVCVLFGIGIFYLFPTDAEYLADKSEETDSYTHTSQAETTNPNLQSTNVGEAAVGYSKKILRDKDVEGKSVGFFKQKNIQPTIDPKKSGLEEGELDEEGREEDAFQEDEDKNISNKDEVKIVEGLEEKKALDSLRITDFQELEEESTLDSNSVDSLEKVVDAQGLEELSDEDSSETEVAIGGERHKGELEEAAENEEELEEKDANSKPTEESKSETITTSKNATKTSNKTTTKDSSTAHQSGGCIIVVGAFEKDHNAQKIIRQLKRKNYTVKTGWRKGLKYVGVPVNCQDKKTVENTLQQLRNAFDIEAWLLKP